MMKSGSQTTAHLWRRLLVAAGAAAVAVVIYGGLFAVSDYFEFAAVPALVGIVLCCVGGYMLGGTIWRYVGGLGWFAVGAYFLYMYMWFLVNVMAYESGHPAWAATAASYWGWLAMCLPTSLLWLIGLVVPVGVGQYFYFTFPLPNAILLACVVGRIRRSIALRDSLEAA